MAKAFFIIAGVVISMLLGSMILERHFSAVQKKTPERPASSAELGSKTSESQIRSRKGTSESCVRVYGQPNHCLFRSHPKDMERLHESLRRVKQIADQNARIADFRMRESEYRSLELVRPKIPR